MSQCDVQGCNNTTDSIKFSARFAFYLFCTLYSVRNIKVTGLVAKQNTNALFCLEG